MLESLYYVLTWACNRRCKHCYDDRFRPYAPEELDLMLARQQAALVRVVANLPRRLGVYAPADQGETDEQRFMRSRIILSGGELLLPGVLERLLFPALDLLRERYAEQEAELVLQTGGDLLDGPLLDALLRAGVGAISVSSMDDFHGPLAGESQQERKKRLEALFLSRGMISSDVAAHGGAGKTAISQRYYNFFGATPDMWIGKLWPSGRAWQGGVSTAGPQDDFCAAWSGAKGFLDLQRQGSEVAIDPQGLLFPCCRKTAMPYADLTQEPLEDALKRLAAMPGMQALAAGSPAALASHYGLDQTDFQALCASTTPEGLHQNNPCLGCDLLHRRYVASEPGMPACPDEARHRTPGRILPTDAIDS